MAESSLSTSQYSRHCCVPNCTSDGRYDAGISFHSFPKDEELKKEWIVKIKRDIGPLFRITACTVVCSKHFTKEDFRYTPGCVKRHLKKGSVPSVFSEGRAPRRIPKRQSSSTENEHLLAGTIVPVRMDGCDEIPNHDNDSVNTVSYHSDYEETNAEMLNFPSQGKWHQDMELMEGYGCANINQEVDTEQMTDYKEIEQDDQNMSYAETHPQRNEFLESIAAVLQQYRTESFLCDTILLVDDGHMAAHSILLCAASPAFKSCVGLLSGKSRPYKFRIGNVKKAEIELILNAIYTGRLDLYPESRSSVVKTLDLLKIDVDKMEKHEMPNCCETSELRTDTTTTNIVNPAQSSNKNEQQSTLNYNSLEDLDRISSPSLLSGMIVVAKVIPQQAERQTSNEGLIGRNHPVLVEQLKSESTVTEMSKCATNDPMSTYNPTVCIDGAKTTAVQAQFDFVCKPVVNLQDGSLDFHFNMLTKKQNTQNKSAKKHNPTKALLSKLRHTYESTGRCPCRNCQSDTTDAAGRIQVFHCDYCLYRTNTINLLLGHVRSDCKKRLSDETLPDNNLFVGPMICDTGLDYTRREFGRRDPRPDGKYMCQLCSAVFNSESEMFDHKITHRRQKMIKCDICEKVLLRESMILHRRSHTGETPELCHLCGEQFDRRASLNNHLMAAHADVENAIRPATIKCPSCTRLFRLPSSLAWHMQQAHGLPYAKDLNEPETADFVCENCGASFNKQLYFQKHNQSCRFKNSLVEVARRPRARAIKKPIKKNR